MQHEPSSDYDVIVIGGGPAGAAAAALVAEGGHRVLLLEKSPEPAFKVGESLMPATYWTLERLGVLERMKASHFPKKYSVQFFSGSGRGSAPFYFFEADDHDSSRTWQVLRSEFDAMLLQNARDKGAEVRLGSPVTGLLRDGEGEAAKIRGVVASPGGGPARRIGARVVIDASGQSTLVARALGLKELNPRLRQASYYTHFANARRDPGVDEGATLILHTAGRESWFWFIPLPGELASVGVVGPVDRLVAGGDPQAVLDAELGRCPALGERLAGATQVRPVLVAKDFSYLSRSIAGDGWVLAGDAYGFLDPIYSSGVFLALKSGELAADAVCAGLAAGDLSGARLGAFGEQYLAGIQAIRRLVYAFYDPQFSFGRFLERFPECRGAVVDLLVGNVYRRPVDGLMSALDEYSAATRAAAGGGA